MRHVASPDREDDEHDAGAERGEPDDGIGDRDDLHDLAVTGAAARFVGQVVGRLVEGRLRTACGTSPWGDAG